MRAAGGESGGLCRVPLIINSSVHLGLQLVGASANRSAVTTSPLGARVLLEVLRKKDQDRSAKDRHNRLNKSRQKHK